MLPKFKTCIILFYLLFILPSPVYAQSPPTFSKTFLEDTIGPGSVSTLRFDISNPSGSPADMIAFTDNLPAGLSIASPGSASTDCGPSAILSAPDSGTTISLTNGQLTPGESCTVLVNVISSAMPTSGSPVTHMNVSGLLSSSLGSAGPASDDLVVTADQPGFTKSFSPSTISPGQTSTLTLIVDNTANPSGVSTLRITDNLPSGMVIASPARASTDCGHANLPPTLTAVSGTSAISLFANGLLPSFPALDAGASCSVTVDVTVATPGVYVNTTSDLEAGSIPVGKATAALDVPLDFLIKSFTDDPAPPGGTVTLEFTITNFDRNFSASGITFTDDLDATLSGLVATGLPAANVCGAGSQLSGTGLLSLTGGNLPASGSCTFSATLQVPAAAAPGSYPNTTTAINATVDGSPVVGNMATDFLRVEPAPALTKQFIGDPVNPGDPVTLVLTATNTSPTSSATDIFFEDVFDTVLPTASVPPASECCGPGSTCTFTPLFNPTPPCNPCDSTPARLTISDGNLSPAGMAGDTCTISMTLDVASDAKPGSYPNTTGEVTAMVDGETRVGIGASDNLTIIAAPSLKKSFTDDPVEPGGTVTLEFGLELSPNSPTAATGVSFSDDLNAALSGLQATGATLNTCGGMATSGFPTGNFSYAGGSLSAGGSCTIRLTVTVPTTATIGSHTNTTSGVSATVSGLAATSAAASDDLNVARLALTKSFTDDPVLPGGTATLEFTLINSSPVSTATNIFFTDSLASALSGLASTSGTLTNICGPGSQLAGTTSLLFTNGELGPGASCTFSVTVQVPGGAAEGTYNNITSDPSFELDGSMFSGDPANDALEVQQNVLLLSKQFGISSVFAGNTLTLAFTMTNSFSGTATGITFTDDLDAAMSGLSATGLPANDVCGAGSQLTGTTNLTLTGGNLAADATCTFNVTLQVSGAAAAGDYTNTTSGVTGSIGGLPVTGDAASADLQVIDPAASGQIIVDKVTDPTEDTTSFDFSLDGSPAGFSRETFSLTDAATPHAVTVEANGVYTLTETIASGWTLTASSCSDGSSLDNINISAGEVVTCTLTNTVTSLVIGDLFLPTIMKDVGLLPDLVVDSVTVTPVSGNLYTIQVVARNQSSAAAVASGNNFFINAYLTSDLNTPIVICGVQGASFGPGQGVSCTGQYTFSSGSHTVRGWVDPFNTVVESNDSNNTRDAGVINVSGTSGDIELRNDLVSPAGPLPTPTPVP